MKDHVFPARNDRDNGNLSSRRRKCRLILYSLFVLALAGLLPCSEAGQKTFSLGGARLTLDEATAETGVFFTAMRFNRAANLWNVDVSLTNRSPRLLQGPFVVLVESFAGTSGALQPDGIDEEGKAFFDLSSTIASGQLTPGERSQARTLSLGLGTGAPQLVTRVFVRPATVPLALGITRTLNEVGQPLPDVEVVETGPQGPRTNRTDSVFGVLTLGQAAGPHTWRFTHPDYLPVWRQHVLTTNELSVIPHPRLTKRSAASVELTPIAGGVLSNHSGTIIIAYPPGAVSGPTTATLTPLTGQTLPGFLPPGWSPLQAFNLELSGAATQPALGSLVLWGPTTTNDVLVLAQWNVPMTRWEVVQFHPTAVSTSFTTSLPGTGSFALVVPDKGLFAPPLPTVGQALLGAAAALDVSSLRATGTVEPASSPASRSPDLVTATASVVVSNPAGPLPSGLVLQAEVRERYDLWRGDSALPPAGLGSTRQPPQYESFLVGYQRPGDDAAATLTATFPMRPLLLFGSEELEQASVKVDLLPPAPFQGSILETNGGLVADQGIRMLAGSGDLNSPQGVRLRRIVSTNFLDFATEGIQVKAAFELTIGAVASGRRLSLQADGVASNAVFVLARVLYDRGWYGLQPVERLASGASGRLTSLEPANGERLAGLTGSGQYLLLQLDQPPGLLHGIAKDNSGAPAAGLAIRLVDQPWLAFSGADGTYQLLAPTGQVQVLVQDLTQGDKGQTGISLSDAQTPQRVDLSTRASGPRIVSLTPPDGATKVSPISAVVLNFSDAVNPASLLAGGLQVLSTNGQPVSGSLTLNPRQTQATFLPANPLAPGALYQVVLSPSVAGLNGRPLEGPRQFSFATLPLSTRDPAAQLTIYEPGATNIPSAVLANIPAFKPGEIQDAIVVHGSPGTADPEVPVILVNESSGETATVLSKVDGSFASFIRGGEEDLIRAVFVNANGTRTIVPASKQLYDDGHVGLYQAGGILEAESDGGPAQLIVEPGSVQTRTRFRINAVETAQLLPILGNTQPEQGKVLGGLTYEEEGNSLLAAADVSFPVNIADLGLPAGTDPGQVTFALSVPTKIDGVVVYHIIDAMQFVDKGGGKGELRTRSPPFVGLMLRQINQLRDSANVADQLARSVINAVSQAPVREPIGGFALLLAPLLMAFSPGAIMSGDVYSVPSDALGALSTDRRPVAGAFVRLDVPAGQSANPGLFRAGEYVAMSDNDGNYAFQVPLVHARFMTATHPRFPLQKASTAGVGTTSPSEEVFIQRADLVFRRTPLSPLAVADTAPPLIRVSQRPNFPASGNAITSGAELEVRVLDDLAAGSVSVSVQSFVALQSGEPKNADLVTVEEGAPVSDLNPARLVRKYRVLAQESGRAILRILAFDEAGHQAEVIHSVAFGAPEFPGGPSGPSRVVFAWPPHGSANIALGTPILFRLSAPVAPENLASPSWITLEPADRFSLTHVAATPDRRQITVWYRVKGQQAGGLDVTLAPPVINQEPSGTGAPVAYTYHLDLSPDVSALVNGEALSAGGGAVAHGQFVYALDRTWVEGQDADGNPITVPGGKVVRYALQKEGADLRLAREDQTSLPARPMDLVLIPNYPLARHQQPPLPARDYLAVFNGDPGDKQFLNVFRIGENGSLINFFPGAPPVVNLAVSQVVKSRWDPPYLAYLELGAGFTSVSLLNFNAFTIGFQLLRTDPDTLASFPDAGVAGVDVNNDGDFVDAGESPPLPGSREGEVFGKEFSWAPEDATEQVTDFDFNADFGLLGVTFKKRGGTDKNGFIMVLGGPEGQLDEKTARVTFDEEPKRVSLFTDLTLLTSVGTQLTADVALVGTMAGEADAALLVVDITVPSLPILLGRAKMPPGCGTLNSIVRRDDGLLALATSRAGVLLLDPKLLLVEQPGGGVTAAVRRSLAGLGSGIRSFVAEDTGLNVAAFESQPAITLTEPGIKVVTFPGAAPRSVTELANATAQDGGAAARELLQRARPVQTAVLANFADHTNVLESASTRDPNRHFYVVMRAPGICGPELKLAAASVNSLGKPFAGNGLNTVPTFLGPQEITLRFAALSAFNFAKQAMNMTDGSLKITIGGVAKAAAQVTAQELLTEMRRSKPEYASDLVATRLSSNPASDLFNTYLAGPIMLLPKDLTLDEHNALQGQLPRRYLQASAYFWVGISPAASGTLGLGADPLLGGFASRQDEEINLSLNTSLGTAIPGLISLGQQALAGNFLGAALLAVTTFVDGELQRVILPGHNQLVTVAFSRRPVVFVPGIAGSELELDGDRVWTSDTVLSSEAFLLQMRLNPDGTSPANLKPIDALRNVRVVGNVPVKPVYEPILLYLAQGLNFREYDFEFNEDALYLDGAPNWESLDKGPDLFVFPYDWRKDNKLSAEKLFKYIRLIQAVYPDADKVDIVAHSNGGLVSRRLVVDHPELVDKFISLGTPFLGAPKAISAMKTGDFDDVALNVLLPQATMKKVARHLKALHQLFPNRGFYDLGARPLVEMGWNLDGDGVAYETYDYNQYKEALDIRFFRPGQENDPAPNPVSDANESFHLHAGPGGGQYDQSNEDSNVRYYHIVGMQSQPKTISRVGLEATLLPSAPTNDLYISLPPVEFFDSESVFGNNFPLVGDPPRPLPLGKEVRRLDYHMVLERGAGDGTVPLLSASRGFGSDIDFNAPGARVIPIVSVAPDQASDQAASHNEMLANPVLQQLVKRILDDDLYEAPRLEIQANNAVEGSAVGFAANLSDVPAEAQGPARFLWATGDGGEIISGESGSHRYLDDGVYTLTCCVGFTNGFAALRSHTVRITNASPAVTVTATTTQPRVGDLVRFRAQVTDVGQLDTHTYKWDFGDDSDEEATLHPSVFSPRHVFHEAGTYTVRVEATDDDGGVGTATLTLEVLPGGTGTLTESKVVRPPVVRSLDGQPTEDESVQLCITGHQPRDDKLSLKHDGRSAYDTTTKVMRFLSGFVVNNTGPNELCATIYREKLPQATSLPIETTFGFAAEGKPRVTVRMNYTKNGQLLQCFRWEADVSTENDQVTVRIPWAQLANFPIPQLPSLLQSPGGFQAVLVSPGNCGDRIGPEVDVHYSETTRTFTIETQDNVTPEEQIRVFVADATELNGDLTQDENTAELEFRPLESKEVPNEAAPGRELLLVGVDTSGKVTPIELRPPARSESTPAPPSELDLIRAAVKQAFTLGSEHALFKDFLVEKKDLQIFEQGTGACLWKNEAKCIGAFTPRKSDNDYEMFFPVFLDPARRLNPDTPAQHAEFQAKAHTQEFMDGDWYFKLPVGVDDTGFELGPMPDLSDQENVAAYIALTKTWVWRMPLVPSTQGKKTEIRIEKGTKVFNESKPLFDSPVTPAQIISFVLTENLKQESNKGLRELLPDISFFPFRRDHFEHATMSLEKPPPFGDDPIGDAGMGRSLLLLKWVLEGAFLPPFGGFNTEVNDATRRSAVFNRLMARQNALKVEGYEWGIYQEYAALSESVHYRVREQDNRGPLDPPRAKGKVFGDYFTAHDAKVLKKVGKAAIRGALARMVTEDTARPRLFSVTPDQFDQDMDLRSFEHLILRLATNHIQLFSNFTSQDLEEFLGAKVADKRTIQNIIETRNGVDHFVTNSLNFLTDQVQAPTVQTFTLYLDGLVQNGSEGARAEYAARWQNASAINFGFRTLSGEQKPGRLAMHGLTGAHVLNYSFVVDVRNQSEADPVTVTVHMQPDNGSTQTKTVQVGAKTNVLIKPKGNDPGFFLARPVSQKEKLFGFFRISGNFTTPDGTPVNDQIDFNHEVLPVPYFEGVLTAPVLQARMIYDDATKSSALVVRMFDETLPAPGRIFRTFRHRVTGQFVEEEIPDGILAISTNNVLFPTGNITGGGQNDYNVFGRTSDGRQSANIIQMASDLTDLYRDAGERPPEEGERELMGAILAGQGSGSTQDRQFRIARMVLPHVRPLLDQVVNRPVAEVVANVFPGAEITVASSSAAEQAIGKPLEFQLVRAGPPPVYLSPSNAGRQRVGEGRIFIHEELVNHALTGTTLNFERSNGTASGTGIRAVDVLHVEAIHELNTRLMFLMLGHGGVSGNPAANLSLDSIVRVELFPLLIDAALINGGAE
jgi:pimeloyl-ACP methyl ester carboxylesterase